MQIFSMHAIFFVYKNNSSGVGVLRHAPLSGISPGLILVQFASLLYCEFIARSELFCSSSYWVAIILKQILTQLNSELF